MDDSLQDVFVEELFSQWRRVGLLMQPHLPDLHFPWYTVDDILVQLTRMTRILWPDVKKKRDRALREDRADHFKHLLGLDDEPPENLALIRNIVEHYDEYLDAWYQRTGGKVRLEMNYGAIKDLQAFAGGVPLDWIGRHFDIWTHEVIIFGERLDLRAAVQTIGSIIQQLADGVGHEAAARMFPGGGPTTGAGA